MNEEARDGTAIKVFFLGRHGEGWHNVAERSYGTPEWNRYWSKVNGDGNMTASFANLLPDRDAQTCADEDYGTAVGPGCAPYRDRDRTGEASTPGVGSSSFSTGAGPVFLVQLATIAGGVHRRDHLRGTVFCQTDLHGDHSVRLRCDGRRARSNAYRRAPPAKRSVFILVRRDPSQSAPQKLTSLFCAQAISGTVRPGWPRNTPASPSKTHLRKKVRPGNLTTRSDVSSSGILADELWLPDERETEEEQDQRSRRALDQVSGTVLFRPPRSR